MPHIIDATYENDVDNKIAKFNSVCDSIRKTLHRKSRKKGQNGLIKAAARTFFPQFIMRSGEFLPSITNTQIIVEYTKYLVEKIVYDRSPKKVNRSGRLQKI